MVDEQLGRILQTMPDAVLLLRANGAICFANNQVTKLLGYTIDELAGRTIESIVPARTWARHSARLAESPVNPLRRPPSNGLVVTVLCKGGRKLAVDIRLSALKTTDGVLLAASLRDISDHRSCKLELRRTSAEIIRLQDLLQVEQGDLRPEYDVDCGFDEFVGRSELLQQLLRTIERVATTDASVLICGETGTGKGLVADAIHHRSQRRDRPLVKLNCAALPSSLVESELFGHEPGAFTGALTRRIGRFEQADGGTIFLDEVGELPYEVQAKLLRAVDEQVFWRLGADSPTQVNVRVIAATNRDLPLAMQQNSFRSDLYYRLATVPIAIPSLRARQEDIPLLTWHFVTKKQAQLGITVKKISAATMDRLIQHPWPGNIRELQNVIERAMILSPGPSLVVEPLLDLVSQIALIPHATVNSSMASVSRNHILRVLQACHFQIKGANGAAEGLQMKPSTLRYRMKKLGIARP